MSILPFGRQNRLSSAARAMLDGYSIEVMPRTAAKVDDFGALLPPGTRVYIAHIEGTPIEDMVATAKRLRDEGFEPMPHFPARIIPNRATFDDWLTRYRAEADVREALVLAGSPRSPLGDFHSAMQLLESGLFDAHGLKRLHVAGHPEGNKDIDPDGSTKLVDEAARWKADFARRTDADLAMVTQFAFDAKPVLAWAQSMHAAGVDLPIHVGVAGPTKLNTLIKFAIACGVGPSLSVLKKRALDLTKLAMPFEPTEALNDLVDGCGKGEGGLIAGIHIFPLGGIKASVAYANTALGEHSLRAQG
ncbi:methylenetetrahydrofolate reductase [Rhodobacterales bacterium LSUCC0246]|nr:methylenetetrahydrofolate reductase [Rhodobacterales bacterium LSUCC0374]